MKSAIIFLGILFLFLFSGQIPAHAQAKKKVLVTSFEAFDGRERNNSSLVSEELNRLFNSHPDLKNDYSLEILVLPVRGRQAPNNAKDYISRMAQKPDLVLSLGESPRLKRERKTIEINFTGYNKPATRVDTKDQTKLYKGWDDKETFNFPIAQMYCALSEKDRSWVALEDSIGSYVCNETAFDLALFLKNNAKKEARARQLISTYESQKRIASDSIQKKYQEEIKKLEDALQLQRTKFQALKTEIDKDQTLSNELVRYYNVKEAERLERQRLQREQKSSNTASNLSWPVKSGATVTASSRVDENFLPKILEYLKELKETQNAEYALSNKVNSVSQEIRNVTYDFDNMIRTVQGIQKSTYYTDQEPYYGFIHIPILDKSSKTNPLEIAQLIALMVRGTFEQNYPHAVINYSKGKVDCGVDKRVIQSQGYQEVYEKLLSAEDAFKQTATTLRTRYPEHAAKLTTPDLIAFAKRQKSDTVAQQLLRQQAEIEGIKVELSQIVDKTPTHNPQKDSFFRGHEKYQPQGTFLQENRAQHLLRIGFEAAKNGIVLPAEIDFSVKLDSNGNIVLVLKNQDQKEAIVPLNTFETKPLNLVQLSKNSSMTIALDNSKSYARYDLRDLKSGKIKYSELNSKIEYWLHLDYTLPVLKHRLVDRQVEENGPEGRRTRWEKVREGYWQTETLRIPMLLNFENGRWTFKSENTPLNLIQIVVGHNSLNETFISSVMFGNIQIATPQVNASLDLR